MRVEFISTATKSPRQLRQNLKAQGHSSVELEAGLYNFTTLLAKLKAIRSESARMPAVLLTDCHPDNLDGLKRLNLHQDLDLEGVTLYAMVEVAK
ncbi:hypothetical protein E8F20_27560 [Pseudomonas sp. BN415]|uniref:hypothetical protein n=1 Tax=Pseudomonas sp. BN415 TaxID=2567889 RepID=UPI002453D1B6|nr:hypothetical protein [Pseudomonas sp. BN415]MDH4585609.1 hypothetical protein [Pseudomonas sp. BN415]